MVDFDEAIMIPAVRLKTLTSFTSAALARELDPTGSKKIRIDDSMFLGITTGGQFCYSVTYADAALKKDVVNKVFLNYDPALGKVSAIKDWH